MPRLFKLLIVFLASTLSANAQSAILAFELEGTINRIFSTGGATRPIPPDFFIELDDIFTATVIIDTDDASLFSSTTSLNVYRLLPPAGELNINASINGANGSANSGFLRVTNDDTNGFDSLGILSTTGFTGDTVNGLTWGSMSILLTDTDGNIFSDTSLPQTLPDPSNFDSIIFSLFFNNASNQPVAQASGFGTSSITVIPIPPALILFGSGLLSLAALRKKIH